jgi:transcriptional regulator with XRE-family HTH domain
MIPSLLAPHEMAEHLAKKVKDKRLSMNLSQQTLCDRSGVSHGVLKKFESTGQISLKSLLKLALVLRDLEAFCNLFQETQLEEDISLDVLIGRDKIPKRKRGRK